MPSQLSAESNESSFSTAIWKFENQLNVTYIGSHDTWAVMYDLYTTHSDIKLTLDDEDDEIRRAQNKTCSERVWECAFPSTCSLELDFQVQTEYQAIDTCEGRSLIVLNRMLLNSTHHIKWLWILHLWIQILGEGPPLIWLGVAVKSIQLPVAGLAADCRRIKNVFHSPRHLM